MSTSIENLRRVAERDVKDHTALFDLYVTVGRDIDYLAIKFGIDPDDLINLLEGYGEKLRVKSDDAKKDEEFGIAIDYSGKGRYKKLSRMLIEEYVEKFYPGIASENPENDWICLEAYLDHMHPGWRGQIGSAVGSRRDGSASVDGGIRPGSEKKRKVRNRFKLY